jgi:orotidine-5'-phosphate decarboxylase
MKKIILALDVFDIKTARNLVEKTSEYIDVFKIGPILFLPFGKEMIKFINTMGKKVFLDLKFHDIPSTVNRSVMSARELGVYSLTVHCAGGEEMLKAATEVKNRPKIWAVTVLTSQLSAGDEAIRRAAAAKKSGADGVIASPLEIVSIKKELGNNFEVVTPGIRLIKTNDDQKRVATPKEAVKNGADFIVVGRPITEAQNPKEAARQISESLEDQK